MDANELVAGGGDMEIRLLLVDEKCVRDPDVLDELGSHAQRLHALALLEGQSRVRPKLSEVKVQRKVLHCVPPKQMTP